MLRFVLNEAGRLLLGLLGAALMAAAIASLSVVHAGDGVLQFLVVWNERLHAIVNLHLGESAITGLPIDEELVTRLPLTLGLVVDGLVAAATVGIPVGILFGLGPARGAAAPLIQVVAAIPVFCAGLALACLADKLLHWPVRIDDSANFELGPMLHSPAQIRAIALPALTVRLSGAAAVLVALSRATISVTQASWRRHLLRLGLSHWEVGVLYVTPQIFAGLFAQLGEVMLALMSATAVAEWVFSCPGIAEFFVKSVALHDWSAAGAILFIFASSTQTAAFVGRCAAHPLTNPGKAA